MCLPFNPQTKPQGTEAALWTRVPLSPSGPLEDTQHDRGVALRWHSVARRATFPAGRLNDTQVVTRSTKASGFFPKLGFPTGSSCCRRRRPTVISTPSNQLFLCSSCHLEETLPLHLTFLQKLRPLPVTGFVLHPIGSFYSLLHGC